MTGVHNKITKIIKISENCQKISKFSKIWLWNIKIDNEGCPNLSKPFMKIISTGNPNSAYPLEGRMMTFQNGLTTTVSG